MAYTKKGYNSMIQSIWKVERTYLLPWLLRNRSCGLLRLLWCKLRKLLLLLQCVKNERATWKLLSKQELISRFQTKFLYSTSISGAFTMCQAFFQGLRKQVSKNGNKTRFLPLKKRNNRFKHNF